MRETSVILINQSCGSCKINKLRVDVSKYVGRFHKYSLNVCMHGAREQDVFTQTTGQLENVKVYFKYISERSRRLLRVDWSSAVSSFSCFSPLKGTCTLAS